MVYKARLHPDAVRGVGSWGHVTATGSANIDVPTGASGILMQQNGTGQVWFCINSPVGNGDGFLLPGNNQITQFWFDPEACGGKVYVYVGVNSDFHYQFISPARPV